MRIGINARFLIHPFTGIGQYTLNLIKGLAKIDLQNEYYLFTPEPVELSLPDNFHIMRVVEKNYQSASLRKAHWEHVLVPREMEKLKIDLAHFPYPSNPCKKLPFKVIVTVHDVIPWKLKAYRKKLRSKLYHFNAKLALKKADHLITVSEFSKKEILNLIRFKENDVSVIYNAPPFLDSKEDFPEISLRRKYILYVGGYDDRKNVPNLILAYQKHIAPFYSIDLILVGGKDQGLEQYLTDKFVYRVAGKHALKAKGKVIFTEHVSDAELSFLYQQAHVFANVSHYEGFNVPLVEAMHYGVPVMTSDIPVHHEVTHEAAVFVDPQNVDAIGNGLHELLNDHAKMTELQKKGKEVAHGYQWKKSAEDTLYVYNLFT